MLCVVKMSLKGEVGGSALNSHGNYIVAHGKSWKSHRMVFLYNMGLEVRKPVFPQPCFWKYSAFTNAYSKTCVKRPLSRRPDIGFQDQSLNAGQKYCRILQHSAILLTFIRLPFVNKIFVLSFLGCLKEVTNTCTMYVKQSNYCRIFQCNGGKLEES